MPLVSFGIGWFFVSLLPVLYIFPQGTAIAEKYLYTASVGFVLVAGFFFTLPRVPRSLRIFIVGLLVIFYGVRTFTRNFDWRSPIALWEHETVVHPQSELAYYNLGVYYTEAGERARAAAAYRKALELKPQFWQAEHNLKNLQKL